MIYLFLPISLISIYLIFQKFSIFHKKDPDFKFKNIFLSSIILPLIYILNSYFFILQLDSKIVTFFILLIIILFFITNFKECLKNIFYILEDFYKYKLIFIILLSYFLIIMFPAFEEDSLRYHLAIAKKIINNNFYEDYWFDYLTIGAHEFINVFFLHINFENSTSLINFSYIIAIFYSSIFLRKKFLIDKENNTFFYTLFLTSPFLIPLLTSQKFYVFPCFMVTFSLAYTFLQKKGDVKFYYLLSFLNIFVIVIKFIFIPYVVLFFLLIYRRLSKINFIKILIFSLISSIILFFPIFLIKFLIYKDPFIPLFSINPENDIWYKEYKTILTNYQMDFTDKIDNFFLKMLITPLKLFIPFSPSDIFKTFGASMLGIFFIKYKSYKNLIFVMLFFLVNVFILLNTQTRWFFPLMIFVSIFVITNNKFLRKLIYLQAICSLIVLIPLSVVTLLGELNLIDKEQIKWKFNDGLKIVDQLNKKYPNSKIYTTLNNYYYFNDFSPIYYPELTVKQNPNFFKKNYKKNDLFLFRSRNKGIEFDEFAKLAFQCDKYRLIDKFTFINSRIFFLDKRDKVYLYKLEC